MSRSEDDHHISTRPSIMGFSVPYFWDTNTLNAPYFVFFYSLAPIPGYSLHVAAPMLREKSQVAMNETRVYKNRLCPPGELPPREASPHLMVSKNLVYVKWICASKSKLTFLFKPSLYGCVQKWVWYRWPNILFPIPKHVVLMVYPIAGQTRMGLSFPFLLIIHI